MGKRALKKRVESLLKRVDEHEAKIWFEENRDTPDQALIRHWKIEISAFEKSIEKARRRLEK